MTGRVPVPNTRRQAPPAAVQRFLESQALLTPPQRRRAYAYIVERQTMRQIAAAETVTVAAVQQSLRQVQQRLGIPSLWRLAPEVQAHLIAQVQQEGLSRRAVARATGLHPHTIARLVQRAGCREEAACRS